MIAVDNRCLTIEVPEPSEEGFLTLAERFEDIANRLQQRENDCQIGFQFAFRFDGLSFAFEISMADTTFMTADFYADGTCGFKSHWLHDAGYIDREDKRNWIFGVHCTLSTMRNRAIIFPNFNTLVHVSRGDSPTSDSFSLPIPLDFNRATCYELRSDLYLLRNFIQNNSVKQFVYDITELDENTNVTISDGNVTTTFCFDGDGRGCVYGDPSRRNDPWVIIAHKLMEHLVSIGAIARIESVEFNYLI